MGSNLKYVDHTYRDFSRYAEDGGEFVRHKKWGNNFPARLHRMLSDPANSHAIAWMPHGRAWRIIDKERLVSEVLPGYYVCKKYESFSRQLNGWGFKRLHQHGRDYGCYYHQCFLRDLPKLTRLIRRLPANLGKSVPFPEGEPDFYRIAEAYPLPPPRGERPLLAAAVANAELGRSSSTIKPDDEFSHGTQRVSPHEAPSVQVGGSDAPSTFVGPQPLVEAIAGETPAPTRLLTTSLKQETLTACNLSHGATGHYGPPAGRYCLQQEPISLNRTHNISIGSYDEHLGQTQHGQYLLSRTPAFHFQPPPYQVRNEESWPAKIIVSAQGSPPLFDCQPPPNELHWSAQSVGAHGSHLCYSRDTSAPPPLAGWTSHPNKNCHHTKEPLKRQGDVDDFEPIPISRCGWESPLFVGDRSG